MRTDWYPASRDAQLHMVKTWVNVFADWGPQWHIPAEHVSQLAQDAKRAEDALGKVNSGTRTPADIVSCNIAFADMETEARFIRKRFLHVPPLRPEHLALLLLRQPDNIPTNVNPPTVQPTITIAYPGGPHLLRITLAPLAGSDPFDERSDYGHAIFLGLMPQGGATVEQAASPKHYLMKDPLSGAELQHWRFTRRKRDFVEFAAEESGMRAFFCARYENQKGEHGPWGPVASAVVP